MTTKPAKKWSTNVSEHSDALDLQQGVFAQSDPKKIAASLKASAEHSDRRKSSPFRSAMSMLTFYINRAGEKLSGAQRKRLDAAKDELHQQFDRPVAPAASKRAAPAKKTAIAKAVKTAKTGTTPHATRAAAKRRKKPAKP